MADKREHSGLIEHIWPAAFNDLVLAYLNRYPSPLSRHIISQDVIERHYNSEENKLYTTKLIHKSGKLPRWAPKGIINRADTWVLEDTILDLQRGTLQSTTRNMDHRSVLDITEVNNLQRQSKNSTLAQTSGTVLSSFGSDDAFFTSYLRQRVQSFGISSFKRNVDRSRASLQLILTLLTHPRSTYRMSILYPDQHPPLPLDLMQDQFVREGILHWEQIGGGFSGHGMDAVPPTTAQIEPEERYVVRRRPDYLEPTNWLWWRSRWRPDIPFELLDRKTGRTKDEESDSVWQKLRQKMENIRQAVFGRSEPEMVHATRASVDGKTLGQNSQ